jgi:C4-dicarboxylate-binding protein DctP
MVRSFAELVAARAGASLKVEFFDGSRLFRDVDVVSALARGQVEMAVPGYWQLDRLAPDVATLMLPSTYGRSREEARALIDGPFGSYLNGHIERSIGVVVLGRWFDLGHAHIFSSSRPMKLPSDIAGKRIRVAGGRGNEERIKALGGSPISISLADLPTFLRLGRVDGLLTTYETIDSSKLQASGIASVLEDREYYPFYVPLVSRAAWDRIDRKTRAVIAAAWEEIVPQARAESERAQDEAKARLVANGLVVYTPSAEELGSVRRSLLPDEAAIARRLGVSEEGLARLREAMKASNP